MPNPPSTDGLPVWLQIAVTLAFFVLSCAVAWRAWNSDKTEHKSTTVAHLADMQPVRDLRDSVLALIGWFERLCSQNHDAEHWLRSNTEEMERLRKEVEALRRSLDRWQAP